MPRSTVAELIVEVKAKISGLQQELNKATKLIEGLEKETTAATKPSEKLNEVFAGMSQKLGQLSPAIGQVSGKVGVLTGGFSQMAGSMGLMVGGIGAAAAAFGVLGVKAVGAAAQMEAGMANVATLVDTSRVSIEGLSQGVLSLSAKVNKSTDDLTNGLYQTISAGVDASEAIQFLEVAGKAATAGLSSTAVSVDALSSILNAYGKSSSETGKIADQLFKTVERGKTTFEELASSIGRAIPFAAKLDVQTEELFGAIATLTKQGLATSEAVTAVTSALTAVLEPSEQAKKEAERLGIQFDATALRAKGFAQFVQDVTQAVGDDEEALGKLIGRKEGLLAMLSLGGKAAQTFADDISAIADSTGAVDRAFEKQQATFQKTMEAFANSLNVLMTQLGTPLLSALTPAIKRMTAFIGLFTTDSIDRFIDSQERLRLSFLNQSAALKDSAQRAAELLGRYERLQGEVSGNAKAQEELRNVIREILTIAPTVIASQAQWGDQLDISTQKLRAWIAESQEASAEQKKLGFERTTKSIADQTKVLDRLLAQEAQYRKELADLVPNQDKWGAQHSVNALLVERLEKKLETLTGQIQKTTQSIKESRSELEAFAEKPAVPEIGKEIVAPVQEAIVDVQGAFEGLWADFEKWRTIGAGAFKSQAEQANYLRGELANLKKSLGDAYTPLEENSELWAKFQKVYIAGQKDVLKETERIASEQAKIAEDLAKKQQNTIEAIAKIKQATELEMLEHTVGRYSTELQALKNWRDEQIANIDATVQNVDTANQLKASLEEAFQQKVRILGEETVRVGKAQVEKSREVFEKAEAAKIKAIEDRKKQQIQAIEEATRKEAEAVNRITQMQKEASYKLIEAEQGKLAAQKVRIQDWFDTEKTYIEKNVQDYEVRGNLLAELAREAGRRTLEAEKQSAEESKEAFVDSYKNRGEEAGKVVQDFINLTKTEAGKGESAWQSFANTLSSEFGWAIDSVTNDLYNFLQDFTTANAELALAVKGFTALLVGDYRSAFAAVWDYGKAIIDRFKSESAKIRDAAKEMVQPLSDTIAGTIASGIIDGLDKAQIAQRVRDYLINQVVQQAVAAIVASHTDLKDAIQAWSEAMLSAVAESGERGAEISTREAAKIEAARRILAKKVMTVSDFVGDMAEEMGTMAAGFTAEKGVTGVRRVAEREEVAKDTGKQVAKSVKDVIEASAKKRPVVELKETTQAEETARQTEAIGEKQRRAIDASAKQITDAIEDTTATTEKASTSGGFAVQKLSGETRDILVRLLSPLAKLDILPGLFRSMRTAIWEMRDAILMFVGTLDPGKLMAMEYQPLSGFTTGGAFMPAEDFALEGGLGSSTSISIENLTIQVAEVADVKDIASLEKELGKGINRERVRSGVGGVLR